MGVKRGKIFVAMAKDGLEGFEGGARAFDVSDGTGMGFESKPLGSVGFDGFSVGSFSLLRGPGFSWHWLQVDVCGVFRQGVGCGYPLNRPRASWSEIGGNGAGGDLAGPGGGFRLSGGGVARPGGGVQPGG